ncbi:hypothetical protein F5Y00DRAFT_259638 [Daldinia vernicosa]|uniref:uncharacterized protein n=1 Tax=Daldinia vernicosa TaxID=114800 RepID=UPI002008D9D5|nr:uncharacterized protein F5Y00DRAFT_259638 [Daldinia vernicosa]KAI0851098.1 hypothetical protein F5Y00DRAFT_259638 [Daldinia vernicosa]
MPLAPAINDCEYIKNLTGNQNRGAENTGYCFRKLEKNQYLSPSSDTTKALVFDAAFETPSGSNGVAGKVFLSRIVQKIADRLDKALKLSGIDPAAELERFGIPVIKDLPGVAGNLQDRYETNLTVSSSSNPTLFRNYTFITTDDDLCYGTWLVLEAHSRNTTGTDGMRPAIQVFDILESLGVGEPFERRWPPVKIRSDDDPLAALDG